MIRLSSSLRVESNLLPLLAQRCPAAARRAVRASTFSVQANARRFVPVDTGALRNSLQASFDRGGLVGYVATNLDYAAPQEYGFRHWLSGVFVAAQPYLRPAALLERLLFIRRLMRELAGSLR